MKISSLKSIFPAITSRSKSGALNNNQKKSNPPAKAVTTMPDQLIIPPARVWNKIEAILDEQDCMKKENNLTFSLSDSKGKHSKVYLATLGLSMVVGVLWMVV